jgi:hypothetical protein
VIFMFLLCFDFVIQCIWFSFQNKLTMDLEHDVFLNGVVEASLSFLFHVVDCIGV